jgi:hypothetical protein
MNQSNTDAPIVSDDVSTGISRRQALWRSAALAAAGLLVPSLARAQAVPAGIDTIDTPAAEPVDTATPAEAEAAEPIDPDETTDWSVDPDEAPTSSVEATYFEAARTAEAADLADADEVHAETSDAATIEFRYALETTKLNQAQESESSVLEAAITAAALDSAERVGLAAKLEAVRETYRARQEHLMKARRGDRHSEQEQKQTSRQLRRRAEADRKANVATAHTAMVQELRAAPNRLAQEARHKQRSQQKQAKRRIAEHMAKARQTRTDDRAAMTTQQQGLATANESLLRQRATRIIAEEEKKRRAQIGRNE